MKNYLSAQIKESEYYHGAKHLKQLSNEVQGNRKSIQQYTRKNNYSPSVIQQLSSHSPLSIAKAKLCTPPIKNASCENKQNLNQKNSQNSKRIYAKNMYSPSTYNRAQTRLPCRSSKNSQNYSQSSNEGETKTSTKKQSYSYSQSQDEKNNGSHSFSISQLSQQSMGAPILSQRRKFQSKSTLTNNSEKKDSIQLIETPHYFEVIQDKLEKLEKERQRESVTPLPAEQMEILNEYQMQKIEKIKEDEALRAAITGLTEIRSKQNSISNEIRSKKISEIRSKTETQSSCQTFKSDETHQIWDNKDLEMRGIDFAEIEKQTKQQQFLQFYKMRFGAFPNMKNSIANGDVVRAAINFAKTNKQMFKKYFPSKKVIFEDDTDYSKDHQFEQDPNFIKFMEYVNFIMDNNEVGGGEGKKAELEEVKEKGSEKNRKANVNLVQNRLQNRKVMKTSISKVNSQKVISMLKTKNREQKQK